MAYDSLKARKAIQTASVYERLPGSEFVMEMARILKEADEEIAGSTDKIRLAERESRRYQKEADDIRDDYKRLKEGAGRPLELALATLKDIAAGGKGSKAKAAAALKEIIPEAPATAGAQFETREPIVGDRIGVSDNE